MTIATGTLATQSSVNSAIKQICDIMRRSNCAGALQYVPELTWLLFLRILDEWEEDEAARATVIGDPFTPSLEAPYRWQDWGAKGGALRTKLTGTGSTAGAFRDFVNDDLLPHVKTLGERSSATARQKVISQVMDGIAETRIDSEKNLLDVLDKLDEVKDEHIDPTHVFPLSQVYEGLLLKMGEKGNDGGQFFTPREIIRAMVRTIDPKIGETVYDPACGTGGFLAQSFEHMAGKGYERIGPPSDLETLRGETFYGREKDNLIYPIALANLMLHGIDEPHIWHGNTLTGAASYAGLWEEAPPLFDVVLMNPPFGGKEGEEAQAPFAYKTRATELLFLQHIINHLKPNGRCGIVMSEGVMFRTNEQAYRHCKRMLLDNCDLWCVVSLPAGTFVNAGAGVKTNLLFFTRGGPTEKVWYYDLSQIKVGKKTPLTLAHFAQFFELLPTRGDSEFSWTVTREEIEAKNYDLKAVNPNARTVEDTRTPAELLDIIEAKGVEVAAAVAELRKLTKVRS